jgi:hypothetical protein
MSHRLLGAGQTRSSDRSAASLFTDIVLDGVRANGNGHRADNGVRRRPAERRKK